MKRVYLLPKEGEFFKANLHSHTTYSDGRLTPVECKTAYMERGYSIVAITDHNCYQWHKELCDDKFLALAAVEVNIDQERSGGENSSTVKTYHLNLFDTQPWKKKDSQKVVPKEHAYQVDWVNQYIAGLNQMGFLACYNHPYWSLQDYEEYTKLKGFWAMEIYNYGCDHDGLYGYSPRVYDDMLRKGIHLAVVATDDNHNWKGFDDPFCDSFGGFTMIKSRELSYGAVMEALKCGDFYSTMGPEIHAFYIEDGALHIKTGPVQKIFVHLEGRVCYKAIAPLGEILTEASFPLTGEETYLWVECRDEKGRYACTNAVYDIRKLMAE